MIIISRAKGWSLRSWRISEISSGILRSRSLKLRERTTSRLRSARYAWISDSLFHSISVSAGWLGISASIRRLHDWHSHMPFSIDDRCSGVIVGSNLGPPADAAVMCAATPILALPPSPSGPTVALRHEGLEQLYPLCRASFVTSACLKSSLMPLPSTNTSPQYAAQPTPRASQRFTFA